MRQNAKASFNADTDAFEPVINSFRVTLGRSLTQPRSKRKTSKMKRIVNSK